MGAHQTAALRRCVIAGAPLGDLRDGTWLARVDQWGRAHPLACTEVAKTAPTVEPTFDDLLAADPDPDAPAERPEHPEHGRAPVQQCHRADVVVGPQRLYLRELDARVRILLDVRDWIERDQVPFAVTSRARALQDDRLGRFPGATDLTSDDATWLAAFTATVDAGQLDAALAALPGSGRAAQMAVLLRMLTAGIAAAGPYDGPPTGRNVVGVVAREAVALALSGQPVPEAGEAGEAALAHRLKGRGVPPAYGLDALRLAHAAAAKATSAESDQTGPADDGTAEARQHLAAFTVGINLDIPKDGLAGLAVAAVWLGATVVHTYADLGVAAGVPESASRRRGGGRGVAVVPVDLARLAARLAALDRSGGRRGFRQDDFDVDDAGPCPDGGDADDGPVLATMLRLWKGSDTGPLTRARHALAAAVAVHC